MSLDRSVHQSALVRTSYPSFVHNQTKKKTTRISKNLTSLDKQAETCQADDHNTHKQKGNVFKRSNTKQRDQLEIHMAVSARAAFMAT